MRKYVRRCAWWAAGVVTVVVVLTATVPAGRAQAAPAPFTYSAVDWTGSTTIVAAIDNAGDLYYWWEPDGSSTFNQELVATGLDVTGAPAIGWTGNTVIIAASIGTQVDYWYQYAGTQPWHEQRVATAAAGTSWGPAAIGWTGSSVIIAAVDNDASTAGGELYYWYEPVGSGTWNQQQVATGVQYGTTCSPSIGWTGSRPGTSSTWGRTRHPPGTRRSPGRAVQWSSPR